MQPPQKLTFDNRRPCTSANEDLSELNDNDLRLIPEGYEAIRLLGQGALGLVIHARDCRLDREVAIKILKLGGQVDPDACAALLTEARAIARVRHPALVEIYHCGQHEGVPYLVMEYVKGTTLRHWLSEHGDSGVTLEDTVTIIEQVASAIAALHAAGSAHRDIKPENLVINDQMAVKLVDFGLAGLSGERGPHQGATAGTPDYMAPEIIKRGLGTSGQDQPADVYAIGVLTYELLTGETPFSHENWEATLASHLNDTPLPPSMHRRELAPAFDALIFRALSKFPLARPNATTFARRLARAESMFSEGGEANTLKVLCVDDDMDICAWIREVIESAFVDVKLECVMDGRDALEIIDQSLPDIVITDIDMPRLNGIELASVLRERPATSHIPVLVISAAGSGHDWAVLKEIGAAKMLLKPLDEADFLDDFVRVLRRHRKDISLTSTRTL